jgi:hypothetical protein
MNVKRPVFLVVLVLFFPTVVGAIVASSSNYVLERDSVNFGGLLSNSANYYLEDTAGEIGTGPSGSSNINVRAGYQQMDDSAVISVQASGTVVLSPSFNNLTAGTASGQSGVLVVTNSSSGYNLYVQAANSPALTSSNDSFLDYTPSTGDPDFSFAAPSGNKVFAYTPEGADVANRFRDDGSSCGAGLLDTADSCWDGLTTSPVNIATSNSLNSPSGTYTTIKLKAGVGSGATAKAGTYSTSLIFSAVMK